MLNAKSEVDNMIVRVGFLDKDENYIARLANYYSAHANETVQFHEGRGFAEAIVERWADGSSGCGGRSPARAGRVQP